MKAISIKQPYIDRILSGHKTLELRSWKTNYRGPILLCTSQSPAKGFSNDQFHNLGCAVGIVELLSISIFTNDQLTAADTQKFTPDLFAWEIKVLKVFKPFKIKGRLGLFNVPNELL